MKAMRARRVHQRYMLYALLAFLPARLIAAAQPANQGAPEYQIKAAFLLNFTKFVEWPPSAFSSPSAPLEICILGDDPFGPALDQMVEGEAVNDHKLVVRRIHGKPSGGCQVLFAESSESELDEVLGSLGPGVLTVGDGETSLSRGVVISFVLEHRRVRFDISQRAAAKEELKLSSKLLSVARSVPN